MMPEGDSLVELQERFHLDPREHQSPMTGSPKLGLVRMEAKAVEFAVASPFHIGNDGGAAPQPNARVEELGRRQDIQPRPFSQRGEDEDLGRDSQSSSHTESSVSQKGT